MITVEGPLEQGKMTNGTYCGEKNCKVTLVEYDGRTVPVATPDEVWSSFMTIDHLPITTKPGQCVPYKYGKLPGQLLNAGGVVMFIPQSTLDAMMAITAKRRIIEE